MSFSLLIKGNIVDAERALMLRGFNPSDWLTQPTIAPTKSGHVACVVIVREEDEPGVLRWFGETPAAPPFPVGTLLHYTQSTERKQG